MPPLTRPGRLLLALLLLPVPARALTLTPGFGRRDLRRGTTAVNAKVLGSETVPDGERIATAVTVRVAGGRQLVVLERGGTLDGVTERWDDVPQFHPGERWRLWLRKRTDGAWTTADAVRRRAPRGTLLPAYAFQGSPPAHWTAGSMPVTWHPTDSGDATLGYVNSMWAFLGASGAWTGATNALRMTLDWQHPATAVNGLVCDGVNRLTFNDPFGTMADPVGCGGVVGTGGYCAAGTDGPFQIITTAFVLLNNGFGGCAFWTPANVSEILTHELGHAIGLGHSDPVLHPQAIMTGAHLDGRGATLDADDIAGAQVLYAPTATTSTSATVTTTSSTSTTVHCDVVCATVCQ